MEPLWSPVVATGGDQRQIDCARKRRDQAKSVATGCHRLREKFHGKDGLRFESGRGLDQNSCKRRALLSSLTALPPACSGMEQVLEQPGRNGCDFVV